MLETVEQRNALLTTIEKMRDSTVLAYILHDNAMVADDALPQLYDKLQSMGGKKERIDLLLNARNGIIEVSWRVLNLVREYCDHLGVIVGSRVQGAASLIALGADEIVVGPLSEMGGMEPVRRHPLLPHDESGQPIPMTFSEIKGLLSFLTTDDERRTTDDGSEGRQKAEGSSTNTQSEFRTPNSEIVRTLFQHVHPLVIAHLKQADTLSRDITRKALLLHMHSEDSEKIQRIVDLFNGGFHSPIYTPSRSELTGAGLPITEPDKDLWAAIWGLVQLYQATVYNDLPDNTAPGAFYRYVCLLETVGRLTGLRQSFTQADGQERVLQIRWDTAIRSAGPGPSYGPGGRSNN